MNILSFKRIDTFNCMSLINICGKKFIFVKNCLRRKTIFFLLFSKWIILLEWDLLHGQCCRHFVLHPVYNDRKLFVTKWLLKAALVISRKDAVQIVVISVISKSSIQHFHFWRKWQTHLHFNSIWKSVINTIIGYCN